jgi:hypothetical protein
LPTPVVGSVSNDGYSNRGEVKYHIFLIYLSVVGHIGCFHSLAIINSAAINMGVHVPLLNLTHIPSGISLGVGLLDHMAVLFLGF